MSKNQGIAEDIKKSGGNIINKLADMQRDIQSIQTLLKNNEELLRQKAAQAQREQAERERLEAQREQDRLAEEAAREAEKALAEAQKASEQPKQPEAAAEPIKIENKSELEAAEPAASASKEEQKSAETAEKQTLATEEPVKPVPPRRPQAVAGEQRSERNQSNQNARPGTQQGNGRPAFERADRPQGQGNFNRSQGQGNFNRAQGQGNLNPQGQGSFNRPQQGGFRPQGQQGDFRAQQGQGNFNRPQQGGFRPQGQQGSQQGARPQGQGSYQRSQGQGAYQRPQGQNARPQGSNQRPQSGLKIPVFDASLPTEKGRVSNYDPNKKLYSREHEEKRQNKNAPRQRGAAFDDEERIRGRKPKRKESAQQKMEPIKIEHAVMTAELISIKDLSERLGKPASAIIKKLFLLGIMATINNEIDYDTAALVATDFGIELELKIAKTYEETLTDNDAETEDDNTEDRPPVVTIMGHVDHGKTSLLDAIRSTNVTAHEAGGITQHIGAYTVKHNDRVITFLDTPGHEAFTSMRARGAQVTDIAILVVAADDGVMPQTVEAINHATAAKVPIIVAINKMDKPTANPDRVKQELTNHGILPEEWGGDAIIVPVSAVTGEGLSELLEMILLVADVNQYKANSSKKARGTIVEARLDKGRGPVATVLVQNGTLRVGDTIVAGTTAGRVRAMMNDKGERVEQAGPSMPVEVLGFNDVPDAGDILYSTDDDKLSKQVVQERKDKIKADQLKARAKASLDDLFSQIKEGDMKELNLIVKADVQGSVEAVRQALEKLSNEEVRINVIHGAVGAIKESDVILASASNAIIIGFNVRPDAMASAAAEAEEVDMRMYRVIYNAIEDIEAAMKGMLDPEFKEVVIGHAEVRTTFKVPGVGTIAGAYVTDGKIQRNAGVRLLRDNIVIHEGTISSLKRFKDDAKEVSENFECGIGINGYNDIKENDVIEAFIQEQVKK